VSAVSEGQGGHVTKEYVKIIIRLFSLSVTKEHEKIVIRPFSNCQKRAGAKTLEAFSVAALIFLLMCIRVWNRDLYLPRVRGGS
jgi:isoprenylcysteine carboxyl methyltransferase (ICMT) family protein YpbQ